MKKFVDMTETEWQEALNKVSKEVLDELLDDVNSFIDKGEAFEGLMLLVEKLSPLMKEVGVDLGLKGQ